MEVEFNIEVQKAYINREIEFMKADLKKFKDDIRIVAGILFSLEQLERAESYIANEINLK